MKIAIIGSGGFAKEVLSVVQEINSRMLWYLTDCQIVNGGGMTL